MSQHAVRLLSDGFHLPLSSEESKWPPAVGELSKSPVQLDLCAQPGKGGSVGEWAGVHESRGPGSPREPRELVSRGRREGLWP